MATFVCVYLNEGDKVHECYKCLNEGDKVHECYKYLNEGDKVHECYKGLKLMTQAHLYIVYFFQTYFCLIFSLNDFINM